MASKIIGVRLNEQEQEMLAKISESGIRGDLSSSSMLRLLIHREYNRRLGLPKPEARDFDTDFRNGRPRKGTV